jgi:hypothetical protein
VTVWGEGRHEKEDASVAELYPRGMHGAVASGIEENLGAGAVVRTATLDDPEHGLTEEVLAATDVLTWWGHIAHDEVSDEVVARVQRHVLSGMGLIVLHSGHWSKIFRTLTARSSASTFSASSTRNWRSSARCCSRSPTKFVPSLSLLSVIFVRPSYWLYVGYRSLTCELLIIRQTRIFSGLDDDEYDWPSFEHDSREPANGIGPVFAERGSRAWSGRAPRSLVSRKDRG